MAYLSISASGPEFSSQLEEEGHTFRPRAMADLRYTTADIDFLEPYFREPNVDSGDVELHIRLLNPSVEQFYDALRQIQAWLKSFKDNPDWDGGAFICVTLAMAVKMMAHLFLKME